MISFFKNNWMVLLRRKECEKGNQYLWTKDHNVNLLKRGEFFQVVVLHNTVEHILLFIVVMR